MSTNTPAYQRQLIHYCDCEAARASVAGMKETTVDARGRCVKCNHTALTAPEGIATQRRSSKPSKTNTLRFDLKNVLDYATQEGVGTNEYLPSVSVTELEPILIYALGQNLVSAKPKRKRKRC